MRNHPGFKVAMLVAGCLLLRAPCWARDDAGLKTLGKALRKASGVLVPKLHGKICVGDFTDSADNRYTSEFGQKVPDLLSDLLVNHKKRNYLVMERRELFKILQDSMMMNGDDADTFASLQKHAGVDIFLSGTYAQAGPVISLNIKAVAVKTGELVGAATINLKRVAGLDKMISHRFRQFPAAEAGGETSTAANGGSAAANPGESDLIQLEVGIFYEGGDGRLYPMRDGMVLSSKDNYAIYLKPAQPCYVYVYQTDSSQKAVKLFPNTEFSSAANQLSAREYWIPEGRKFLYLDENPGREDLYVFATHTPSSVLNDLKDITLPQIQETIRMMGVAGKRDSEVLSKVKGTQGDSLELITRKLAARGDFFYRLSFVHQ